MVKSPKSSTNQQAAIRKLSQIATFTLKDAALAGIPRTTVARLVDRGVFTKFALVSTLLLSLSRSERLLIFPWPANGLGLAV